MFVSLTFNMIKTVCACAIILSTTHDARITIAGNVTEAVRKFTALVKS